MLHADVENDVFLAFGHHVDGFLVHGLIDFLLGFLVDQIRFEVFDAGDFDEGQPLPNEILHVVERDDLGVLLASNVIGNDTGHATVQVA